MFPTTWLELLIGVLAVAECIEVARHGSVWPFAGLRAWAQVSNVWLARLWRCGFCLAPWTAAGILLAWGWQDPVSRGLIAALAVARAANLLNDLTYAYCRSPNPSEPETRFGRYDWEPPTPEEPHGNPEPASSAHV